MADGRHLGTMPAIIPGTTPGTGMIPGITPDGIRLGTIAMDSMATIAPGATATMHTTDRAGMEDPTVMSHAPFGVLPTKAGVHSAVAALRTAVAGRLAPLARLVARLAVAAVVAVLVAEAASEAVADARHLADDRSEDGDSSLDLKVISAPRSMRQLIV